MNRRTRFWVRRLLMLAMLALIGFALYQTGESEAVEIGQTAPDFELTTLDGKTVRLSEFRGKGVLINFWASWCKPCRDEMPAIQRVYERHRDKGLE
ncbi:MAG: redoxin domain-containing protein, partial [Planifilum fimeticola]